MTPIEQVVGTFLLIVLLGAVAAQCGPEPIEPAWAERGW